MTTGTDTILGTAVICTAVDVEYIAVRDYLDGPFAEREERGTLYQVGTFSTDRGHWIVALAQTGAGNTQAGIELERAISVFRPQCVLFVGVAGGRKDVALGDVVVADYVYDYESGKDTASGYHSRIKTATSAHRLLQRAKQLARDADWQHRIRPPFPNTAPKAVVKPIAAGGKVVAGQKSATAQFLRWYCGDAVAVDMEGHGFLHGAYVNVKVEALVVRGISDLLSGKTGATDERWQPVASRHAAAFAFELLARSTTPPAAGSGGTVPISGAASNDTGGPLADNGVYDFFVSYVPADQEWANWIAWQLEERLLLAGRPPRLFVRNWDTVAGMHETVMRQLALTETARIVLVLTPDYLASATYGMEEWPAVWPDDPGELQRRIVPVRVKACQPEGMLRSIRSIDLVGRNAASAADTLLSGINVSLGGSAKPSTAPAHPNSDRQPEDIPPALPFPGPPVLFGEPPTVPPNWFQDRHIEVEDIERHLGDARTGLVMVVGREGFGKTAMIHRLWERIRTGASPLRVHGLVYLPARGFWPVTTDRVIDGLTALFPEHEAELLKIMVRPHMAAVQKLVVLLTALAGRQVVVAIDAIEELLDENEDIEEPTLRELIDHLVPRADQGVRLLLVGRHAAQAVAQRFPGATHHRNLDEGLPETDAFALLQAMDTDGRLSLDAVLDHDRARLHRLTGGSPRALELTYGVLVGGDFSFTRLLEFMAHADSVGMVVHLLDYACERLPHQELRILQALAIYGRPVQAAAVDHLVGADTPGLGSRVVLEQLRQHRLVQAEGDHFSVPATEERDYLIELLRREADAGACETPEALLHRAADYFVGKRCRKPQRLSDLRPNLIEIELRVRAGQYRTAFEHMEAVDDGYLLGWGSSSALVPSLRMLLRCKGIPRTLEIEAESMLARTLMQQEHNQAAAEHLVHAFWLASGFWRILLRIVLREQLSVVYRRLGDLRHATMHSRRACRVAMLLMQRRDAMTALADLAMCRARQGEFRRALRLFARALRMLKRFGASAHRVHWPAMLFGAAWSYGQLGDRTRARSLLQEGQRRAVEIGDRRWEGKCLLGEAQLALDERNLEHAVQLAERVSTIGVSNGNPWLCRDAMEILAIARLDQDDLDNAARAADIAQRTRGSVLGSGLVGLVAYRQDNDEEARAAFRKAYAEASKQYRAHESDFQFLDTYGLVACGLTLLGEPSYLTTALNAYQAAREITAAHGAVERTSMLLRQFEPRADPKILERVRAAAKGERSGPTAK